MGAGGALLQVGTDNGTITTSAPTNASAGGTEVSGADLLDPVAPLAEAIQSLFPTLGSRLLATVATLAALFVAVALLRRAGPRLKERFDDTLVESAQTTVVAVLTAVGVAFLIAVWRGLGTVGFLLAQFEVRTGEVVLFVFTLVVLGGAYALTRATKRAVAKLANERGTITEHQQEILHHTVQIGVYAVALLAVLGFWEINVGGLLVGAGVAGLVVGLAARQTLGAIIAGFVVLFARPFELGDWVIIDDWEGVVTDVSIFNTQLRTFNDEYVMIPNDTVTESEIVNRTRRGRLRLNLDVGVDYSTDIERAVELAEEAMAGHDVVLDPPDPEVVLTEFGDSAVVLRLRFYIDNPSARKMWTARTEVIADVKRTFDEAGVKIPFPQRELSGREETDGLRVDAASASAFAAAAGGDGAESERGDGAPDDGGDAGAEETGDEEGDADAAEPSSADGRDDG